MITTIAFYSALIFVAALVINFIKDGIIEDQQSRYKRGNDKDNDSNQQLMLGMAEDEDRREQQYG